ncbi:Asp-tRNA(Asn)/Glu-tRNA(Gln) amidotransferase subunit GatA [Poriferisphaera sp. WC338]|uniref:Asp-tRNA(Asn)/Glu-tRNA(Gln) amidotransferase subunit GatA n=1 Tax=Poriferisphaera sp. WC338 TaxID=3425129 RepID=UPI003D8146B2
MNVTESSLVEIRDAIADKKISAVEVTEAYLKRAADLNGSINAYRETYDDRAIAKAKAVDAGEAIGPLAGVPIAIKDLMCTEYGRTSCSSNMLGDFHASYNCTAVKRLEDAGAVVIGKTNMDEFAMGSSTETCAFGSTQNPWDQAHVPGGSSGGAAAAMAADFCAGSLGSDTGGSIRQPAALCGVVGLKPTYGRVSRWGLVAFASSLDQIGPLTHTVEDAALLLKHMGGHDELDSTSANIDIPADLDAIDQKPDKLRIGIAKQYMSDEANDPAVSKAVAEAIEIYKSEGAKIVEVDLPHTEYGIPVYYIVATAEASSNLARYDGVHYGHRTKTPDDLIDLYARSRAEGFGDEVKRRIMLGTYALSSGYYDAYYNRALKVRRLISNDFRTAFESCDAILCPTTTSPAFKIGEKTDDPLSMYLNDIYTVTANLAGIPGISLPGGLGERDGKKLPIGVQLLGPAFGEANLLRIARLYEKNTDYYRLRPQI